MNAELLKYFMAKRQVTSKKMAEILGINISTFSRKMRGETEFIRSEIMLIKYHLELSNDDVIAIFFKQQLAFM